MRITFMPFNSGGFPENVDAAPGTTLGAFIERQSPSSLDNGQVRITINGQIAARDTVLNDGDRVAVTPVNMKAA